MVSLWPILPIFISATSPWWRHQMETFSALLAFCAGNSPVPGEFPSQRQVTRSFDVSLICALNKRLSKQSWGWWFETPSRLLWRHCNGSNGAEKSPQIQCVNPLHTGDICHQETKVSQLALQIYCTLSVIILAKACRPLWNVCSEWGCSQYGE